MVSLHHGAKQKLLLRGMLGNRYAGGDAGRFTVGHQGQRGQKECFGLRVQLGFGCHLPAVERLLGQVADEEMLAIDGHVIVLAVLQS
jgi:hypothetical protein